MTRKQMTLVYYHVPEDKDDPDCPNVFGVPKTKQDLRLTHIFQTFPLKGSYLFRFKINCQGQSVWLDLPDIDSKIPLFKDRIIMKATRVSWVQSKLHSQYRQKVSKPVETSQKNQKVEFFQAQDAPKKKQQARPKASSNGIDLMGHSPSKQQKSPQVNLLDDGHREGTVWGSKKPEVNLLHSFQHKGDLLS